jgi:hypothetical protein
VDLLGNAEPRYSEGFINSLSGISNDPRLFQVSIPIQPGNSGGPVFNEKGELIAIATSSIDDDKAKKIFGSIPQNVNFAIKSSYVESILPALPNAFIRNKGIVVVPTEEVEFKERVKSDIVLVEAVPEFKPTVVKKGDCVDETQWTKDSSCTHKEWQKIHDPGASQCEELPGSGFHLIRYRNDYLPPLVAVRCTIIMIKPPHPVTLRIDSLLGRGSFAILYACNCYPWSTVFHLHSRFF